MLLYLLTLSRSCQLCGTNRICVCVCVFPPCFQVDKIVDQLQQFIQNYDLTALRGYWSYLDKRLFSRLEDVYRPTVNKLKISLYRYYLVNTVQVGVLSW